MHTGAGGGGGGGGGLIAFGNQECTTQSISVNFGSCSIL